MEPEAKCPCGTGKTYGDCCAPFHEGAALPGAPEALMRSRFCAFVTGNVQYLLDTRHPSRRRADDHAVIGETVRDTRWLGLKILAASPVTGDRGEVEFVACYEARPMGQVHERSVFVREDGRWSYLDGRQLPSLVLGRNDDCPCGSGRKFKKCHGAGSGG